MRGTFFVPQIIVLYLLSVSCCFSQQCADFLKNEKILALKEKNNAKLNVVYVGSKNIGGLYEDTPLCVIDGNSAGGANVTLFSVNVARDRTVRVTYELSREIKAAKEKGGLVISTEGELLKTFKALWLSRERCDTPEILSSVFRDEKWSLNVGCNGVIYVVRISSDAKLLYLSGAAL